MPSRPTTASNTYIGDLRELFTEEALSATTPVYIYCPMHPDTRRPSMRVYDNGAYCFTCGAYMSRQKLLRHVSEVDPDAITGAKLHSSTRLSARSRPALRREELEILAQMAHDNLTSTARRYFRSRGLHDYTVLRYKLGHYGNGYTLPVFQSAAENAPVQTIRFRRDDAMTEDEERRTNLTDDAYSESTTRQTPKYWGVRGNNEVQVYPFPIPEDDAKTVILTEGEFDALLLRQDGLNAYSLTNGARAWQKVKGKGMDWEPLLPKTARIRLCYDNDAAGQAAAAEMSAALQAAGYTVSVETYWPEMPKDITQLRQEDAEVFFGFTAKLGLWEAENE